MGDASRTACNDRAARVHPKHYLDEMDCVLIHSQRRRASKNKDETVKYATKVAEGSMRELQMQQQRRKETVGRIRKLARTRRRRKHGELFANSSHQVKDVPRWGDLHESSTSPASNCDSNSFSDCNSCSDKNTTKLPPWSTHDARVETFSRRTKKLSVQLQREADLQS